MKTNLTRLILKVYEQYLKCKISEVPKHISDDEDSTRRSSIIANFTSLSFRGCAARLPFGGPALLNYRPDG